MKCFKAREYYFKNRDGLLNEAERMRLQDHLAGCQDCALFKNEMDESLELLGELSEPKVSENFEWNVKRRIAREKVDILRKQSRLNDNSAWGFKFLAGAAAMIIIVLSGAWYFYSGTQQGPGEPLQMSSTYENSGAEVASGGDYGAIRFTNTGYPTGFKMVSDDLYEYGADNNYDRQLSSQVLDQSRLHYLKKENLLLRNRVIKLKRENIILRRMLDELSKDNN
ncbi:zf-HC2 domain-containing protein [bacterium]|nr:zf-HC2 domain-containing protein [bacterium]